VPRLATFEYPVPTIWKVTSITFRTAILASSHRKDHRAVNKTSSAVVVRWNLRRSNEKTRVMQRDAHHGVHRRPRGTVAEERCIMKIFFHRWLGRVGAIIGAVTGQIISKNTHAGYPAKLVLVAMLSGVLAAIGARIGQRLEQRRSQASYSV
jgi:hypothetical protein